MRLLLLITLTTLLQSDISDARCCLHSAAAGSAAAVLYDFLSANRISLGNALDGIIAAKRVNM
jgi:uncharacterized MnhB-related membrane protein